MSKKRVRVMVTAFRDGFQSVYGARVLSADFLPAVEAARDAGVTHFESGGGATFQSAFLYAAENAFDVMDSFRKAAGPEANLQSLARGINVVGLDSQSSDIIRMHAQLFAKHGVTTIRNFDALNDVNNLIYSGHCIAEAGLNHEVCVTLMGMPPGLSGAHTAEFYENVLRRILDADIPYTSVCFKDASGTAPPQVVYETIGRARKLLPQKATVVFHTHETAGTGVACYKAALEAGADQLDLSLAPVSGGTCQADVVTMWHALRGTRYDLGLDIPKILEAEEVFKECMRDYFLPPEAKAVEPRVPFSPMPGGALTANTQLMRDNGTLDRFPEVIAAMEEVVRRGGFGTSVTPVSQFYFQQAYNNVLLGPWNKMAQGYGLMVLGYFGRPPVEPDPEIVELAAKQLEREPCRVTPLELNDADPNKGVDAARNALEQHGLPVTDENIFIVATCKEKGVAFLKGESKPRLRKVEPEAEVPAAKAADSYTVRLDGRPFTVVLKGDRAVVDGREYALEIAVAEEAASPAAAEGQGTEVQTPLAGSVLRIDVKEGQRVREGDTLLVVEAMKMETEITAPVTGTVSQLAVGPGEQVTADQTVAWIG
ncbi:MAG: biotin/lipoyl-containing protein [Candidatus Bipolaricaulota bacterium]